MGGSRDDPPSPVFPMILEVENGPLETSRSSSREPFFTSMIMRGRKLGSLCMFIPWFRCHTSLICLVLHHEKETLKSWYPKQKSRKIMGLFIFPNLLEGLVISGIDFLQFIDQQNEFRLSFEHSKNFKNIQWFSRMFPQMSWCVLTSHRQKEVKRQLTNSLHAVGFNFETHFSIASLEMPISKVCRCWFGLGLLQGLLGQMFKKTARRNAWHNDCYLKTQMLSVEGSWIPQMLRYDWSS